jgi:hypothetical protein
MPDSNPFRDPTPVDLEMLRDEMAGKPLPRKASEGIADMEARIKQLAASKKAILDHLEAGGAHPGDTRWDTIADLNRWLTEATERLAEYRTQQAGLN